MDIKNIESIIKGCAAGTGARIGIYFKDLNSGEEAGHAQADAFPSASVFKVFVLAEMFRQIKEGRFSLFDRYEMNDSVKSAGSGVLQHISSGTAFTVEDYAVLMMIISDNTAADFLFRLVGKDNILNNVIRPLGLNATKCDLECSRLCAVCYGLPEDAGYEAFDEAVKSAERDMRCAEPYLCVMKEDDTTSPSDIARMFELLYRGEWIDRESSSKALEIMKLCQTNARIPKYLPHGVSVAHKTGSMDRVANDAGIVYTEKGDYVLAVFYNGNTAPVREYEENAKGYRGEELIARLSRDIYAEYAGLKDS